MTDWPRPLGKNPRGWLKVRAGWLLLAAMVFGGAHSWGGAADTALRSRGTIDSVTVYRGQAMVTRVIELPNVTGTQEVIVESLPAEVVSGSIYAESSGDLAVRSVRYHTRPVREDVRDEVRKLDDGIQEVERKMRQIEERRETLGENRELVRKLEEFTAPSMDWELSHGVLDAKALETITGFLFEQRERINKERLSLLFDKQDLEGKLDQLKREREALTQTSSKTVREAIVWVEVEEEGGTFELRYLVGSATWSPSYNIRGPASRETVELEYLASIEQTSGEDWEDVKMTLSTASPSLVSEPPKLTGLSLTLRDRAPQQAQAMQQAREGRGKAYVQQRAELARSQANVAQQRAQGGRRGGFGGGGFAPVEDGDSQAFDVKLNRLGAEQQLLDLRRGQGERDRRAESPQEKESQQASVRYELSGRTSLPSRADPQLVRIAKRALDAEYFRLARPVLTGHVYEQAKLTNTMEWALLAGPANSYLDGQFVGRGTVPGVSVGESFQVGFGIDSSLHAQRELLDREETTQGGNQLVRVSYRLRLANYADQIRSVRLFDRLPVPKRGEDVQVELVDTTKAPTKSPANANGRIQAGSDGIIRWDVEVPEGATGDNRLTVDYTFTMEYARQKEIDLSVE